MGYCFVFFFASGSNLVRIIYQEKIGQKKRVKEQIGGSLVVRIPGAGVQFVHFLEPKFRTRKTWAISFEEHIPWE